MTGCKMTYVLYLSNCFVDAGAGAGKKRLAADIAIGPESGRTGWWSFRP